MHEDATFVRVLVRDDGKGFDPRSKGTGFGLLGRRERAALLGGELQIDAPSSGGTELRASIPVHRADAAQEDSTSVARSAG